MLFLDALRDAARLVFGGDPYTLSVIWFSFKVAFASLAIAIIIGLPLGILLGTTRFAGRLGFLTLVNAAMGLPPVVVGLITFMILRNDGVLGGARLLFTPAAMVIAQVPLAAPLIAGITMASISALPKAFKIQATALGASRIQQATLLARQARASIFAAIIAGFGATISEVGAILITGGNLLVGGKNYTRTMTTAIVLETRLGNFARAMAFASILLMAILIVNIFFTRAQGAGRFR